MGLIFIRDSVNGLTVKTINRRTKERIKKLVLFFKNLTP